MSKYYKFHYDAGYVGTDVDEVFKFSDDTSERKVEEIFDDWYDDQRSDSGVYEEISEDEAEEIGIDKDLEEE